MASIKLINGERFEVLEDFEKISGTIHAHTRTGGGTVTLTRAAYEGQEPKKRTLIIQNILFIDP